MTAATFNAYRLPGLFLAELEADSEWWHCYELKSPLYDAGPLSTNPGSKNRFALVNGVPPGTLARPSYYISQTERSALFETILRHNNPDPNGDVRLRPDQLANRGLVQLRLKTPMPVIMLHRPMRDRLGITPDDPLDATIDLLTRTSVYAATHEFAGSLDAQCRADPTVSSGLPALMWTSRQINTDLVAVLFTPPNDDDVWEVGPTIVLDTDAGRDRINAALAAGRMQLAGDLDFTLPPGAGP